MPLRGDGVRSDFGFLGKLVVFPDYSFEITRTGSPSLPGWGFSAFCGHTEVLWVHLDSYVPRSHGVSLPRSSGCGWVRIRGTPGCGALPSTSR